MIEEPKEKPAVSKKRKLAEMEAELVAKASEAPKLGGDATPSNPASSTIPDQPTADGPAPSTAELPQDSQPLDQISPPPPPHQPETTQPDANKHSPTPPPHKSPQQSSFPDVPPSPSVPAPLEESIPPQQNFPDSPQNDTLPAQQSPPPPPTITAPPPPPAPSHPPFILAPPQPWHPLPPLPPRASLDGSAPVPGLGYNPPPLPSHLGHMVPSQTSPFAFAPPLPAQPQPQVEMPAPPPAHETTSRNLLILSNFDEVQVKDRNVQTQILFGRKFLKASSMFMFMFSCRYSRPHLPPTGTPIPTIITFSPSQPLQL